MHSQFRVALLLTAVLNLPAVGATQKKAHKKPKPEPSTIVIAVPEMVPGENSELPITTSCEDARQFYLAAMVDWENLQTEHALEKWRAATEKDHDFAIAYLWISYYGQDPLEASDARSKAKSLAMKVTSGEQLFIQWLTGVGDNDYVLGIAAMNDVLQRYPGDKRLALMAGRWLMSQQEYEASRKWLERAIGLDANYAAPYNYLAYSYALSRDYVQALAAGDRYVALLPNEPNPQDSYAEILRMAGRYEEAVEHYRAALQIDPKFHSSQLGIGDTYALMGRERKAREEYFKARVLATDKATEIQDALQEALTYVRQKDFLGADNAFAGVAQQAHRAGLPMLEAEALRLRAELQLVSSPLDLTQAEPQKSLRTRVLNLNRRPAGPVALSYLDTAEQVLADSKVISQVDRQEELARLLRLRAEWLARVGRITEARNSLRTLDAMVAGSRSRSLRSTSAGAQGAVLLYEGKYAEAIASLELDTENPFSLYRLSVAYQQIGKPDLSQENQTLLLGLNSPSPEQALLLPVVRDKILAAK